MIAPTVIMRRLTPQFELHLICRKRHLPLKGKTKGGAAKNSACTTGLRSSHGFRQCSEPGTGNHRIGSSVNSPLKIRL